MWYFVCMKICTQCRCKKPLSAFYAHPETRDGRSGKCKECTKIDVRKNYRKNRDYYQSYERQRWLRPERRKAALEYQRRRRAANPEKYRACNAVSNAIRDGRLTKAPCEVCGKSKVEAHHDDYSKPLEVNWLCRKHHLYLHGKKSYD